MADNKRKWADGASGRPNKRRGSHGAEQTPPAPIEWPSDGGAPTRRGIALWDFSGGSDPISKTIEEPSPDKELKRASLLSQLRQRYADACREVLGLERPPGDSVDRWLLEQLAQPHGGSTPREPLLPRPRIGETSRVLLRELLAEVPLRCHSRVTGPPALDALRRYHQSAEQWLKRLEEPTAQLRHEVDALGEWIQTNASSSGGGARRRNAEECPYRQKLDSLVVDKPDQTGLSIRFHVEVEPKAVQVVRVMSDEAERVAAELLAYQAISTVPATVELEEQKSTANGPAPAVLRYGEDVLRISGMHIRKLRCLYEVHNPRSQDLEVWEATFRRRLYAMLRRYVTFIGLDPSEEGSRGGNMHAAAPESVFAWLRREMGVTCELFASPLNCYFSHFHSAFPDVDAAFGSRGSFFDLDSLPEGSYEVGPPYTEEVMDLMARKLLVFLKNSGDRALSFVIFVPDWGDACTALGLMGSKEFEPFRQSRHGGAYVLAKGREHQYISGVQFFADSGADASRRYYVVPHGTRIYVLQNTAGAAKWPFTQAREQALLERLRPPVS